MDADRKRELLVDMFPELSAELQQLLRVSGEHVLAQQISGLRVLDRCRCGDDFCATFYTEPKPNGPYGPGLRTLALEPMTGELIIDVVNGRVAMLKYFTETKFVRSFLRFFLTNIESLFAPIQQS